MITSPPSSSVVELTEEQLEAVRSDERSLVVTAAAGSGKTRVLVERYLKHIVEDGLSPDDILCITFTRKAAAQMKERIVGRLKTLGMDDAAQTAETGPVQTIDGFCERLLRENSLAAGIDPEFEILSESQSSRFREDAIREAIAYPPSMQSEALISLLAGKRTYGGRSPHAQLEGAIRETLGGLRGTGVSHQELWARHQDPALVLGEWRRLFLEEGVSPEAREHFLSSKDATPDQSSAWGAGFASKLLEFYGKKGPKFLRPTVNEDLAAAEHACGLVQLVCRAWVILERRMRAEQRLDFVALEGQVVELIKTHAPTKERVRRQYKVMLVDESQDLSPTQHVLIEEMGIATEMLVGDAQQSIYGFRQADVQLFEAKAAHASTVRLSENKRSKESILAFVDDLFIQLWPDAYTRMRKPVKSGPFEVWDNPDYDRIEFWLQPMRDTRQTALWIAELLGVEKGFKAKEMAVLTRNAQYAIDLLRQLETIGVPARIAGGTEQFYTRLEVRDLANALTALVDPTNDLALLALLRSPFVGLSLDSIVVLGAADRPALTAIEAVRLPVEEDQALLETFQQWFKDLRRYGDRLSAWEVISELFARTPYLPNLAKRKNGAQLLANVRKLLQLAIEEPELGPAEFAEQIREIQNIRHKEGDAPANDEEADEVTIMTIHKSKGLEFPVVVLPDTHKHLFKKGKDVEVDQWLPMVTCKFTRTSSMFHDWLTARRQAREEAEEWRVMYVAMTRAKDRLCITVSPGINKGYFADRICKALGYKKEPPAGVTVRSA